METNSADAPPPLGTTTRAIGDLLPEIRQGSAQALDELIVIAYKRLVSLIRGTRGRFSDRREAHEPTEVILADLYLRLRTAVTTQRLAELRHPAGFWGLAADHVVYVLLDQARARARDRRKFRQGTTDDAEAGRSDVSSADERPPRYFEGPSPSHDIDDHPDSGRYDPFAALQRMEVLEAVRALPESLRIVVGMYFYLGMSQSEIAEALRPTCPTIHTRQVGRDIDRAKRMLRDVLDDMT